MWNLYPSFNIAYQTINGVLGINSDAYPTKHFDIYTKVCHMIDFYTQQKWNYTNNQNCESGMNCRFDGICANTSRVSVEKEIQINFIDTNLQNCMATNVYRWSNITYQNIQVHIWYGTFSYSVSNSDD